MKEIEHIGGLEEAPVDGEEVIDPMAPENAVGLSLIVLMRIYDTQLAILREHNEENAEALGKLHANGGLLGPMPWIDPEAFN